MAKKQIKQKKKRNLKFLWAILALVAFPVAFNLLSGFMTKRYTAEMRLMVDETTSNVQSSPGPFAELDDVQNRARARSAQTQLDILTGTIVLQDALRMARDRIPDKIKTSGSEDALYENLVRRLQVDNEPTSDILAVHVTEDDPEVAAEIANDIGLSYIDYTKRLALQAGQMMSDQLKLEIDPMRAKLKSIDASISELKKASNIYDVAQAEANIGSTKEVADRSLASAQANYEGGKAQLAVAEAQLKEQPIYIQSSSHTQVNPVLLSIQTSLATERVQLAQLQSQYQDAFPLVKDEKKKIADLEHQLSLVAKNIPSGEDRTMNPVYQNEMSALAQLRAQVQAYAGQLAAAKIEQQRSSEAVEKIPAAEQKLQGLLRDRTVDEQTLEQLEQRQATLQNNGMARQSNSEVVSPALPPSEPSFPDHKLLTMSGLALGIFFAVLILMPRPDFVTTLPEPSQIRTEPLTPETDSLASSSEGAKSLSTAIKNAKSAKFLTDEEHAALAAGPAPSKTASPTPG